MTNEQILSPVEMWSSVWKT